MPVAQWMRSVKRRRGYTAYIASLAPLLWYNFNETSGTTVINYGSLGSAQNGTWTPGAGALGQTGKRGVNEAYNFDGASSKNQLAATANVDKLAFTHCCLVYSDTAGEGSNGRLWSFATSVERVQFNAALTSLSSGVTATGAASSVTTTGLTAATWAWVFMTYDDSGDRKVRLYKGINGVVTEFSYSTQTAATGTRTSQAANSLVIGNNSADTATFDGLFDEYLFLGRVLSVDEMNKITYLGFT